MLPDTQTKPALQSQAPTDNGFPKVSPYCGDVGHRVLPVEQHALEKLIQVQQQVCEWVEAHIAPHQQHLESFAQALRQVQLAVSTTQFFHTIDQEIQREIAFQVKAPETPSESMWELHEALCQWMASFRNKLETGAYPSTLRPALITLLEACDSMDALLQGSPNRVACHNFVNGLMQCEDAIDHVCAEYLAPV